MYNFEKIEKKWQDYWLKNEIYKASNKSEKPKFYYLIEFPYPSGSGLHVGHVRSYTALDAMARKKRMEGFNVLFPIGWDAFGSPAEQYAIKNHIHPSEAVEENIKVFKNQILDLGILFDWSREISTCDPCYYKWTQWQFLKFFENGMAYKTKKSINWCPNCKTGLSNEEASGGECERCGKKVVQKEKEQWMLRMKDYSEDLINDLELTDFQNKTKIAQVNWIGKSSGAEINIKLKDIDDYITIFTTRPDTIYGVTFIVLAPEHPIIEKLKHLIKNYDEFESYKSNAKKKTEFERIELNKEKTGIKLEGLKAVNPLNNKEVEIWVADYVMMNYGTGAIMAVPAHDERDYDFAKKYDIDIISVIEGGNIEESAYTGEGKMINSDILNGINNKKESINKIIKYLEENNLGKRKENYRLQDWIFSRQRFWGEPIPLVFCEKCGFVAVPENELPVTLPNVAKYEPSEDGESPLSKIESWVNTKCPKCGGNAKRETDTMPNWAGSSWYWLRYMDPYNSKEFVSSEALNYWGMVDYYNGGMEHAARHLLYARFWHKFLYNIGLVPTKEPFKRRVSHGMILGSNNEKMSKSKGNVVNPTDVIKEYGADALRCYEMFIGDYSMDVLWNDNGLRGCNKFLNRVYKTKEKIVLKEEFSSSLEVIINQTIKKVTLDLENMKYNTAVSSLMILLNEFDKYENITSKDYKTFLHLLNPICPHITEELNSLLGNKPLCESKWPIYDETKLQKEQFELVVQINGKVRGKEKIPINLSEQEVKDIALSIPNIENHLKDKEILKVIMIPNKLINFIVK